MRAFTMLFALVCCAFSPSFARAQVANPPAGQATTADRERLLEAREEEAARAASEAGAPGLAIEGSVSAPPQEFPCFAITDIDIDGVETLSAETVQRVVSPYANTCMGQIAVDSILQALTQAYLDEGLITSRAYLPEQDLSTGRLLIVVIEGRIEDVRFARVEGDEALPGPPLRFSTAFPTRVGDLLNLRDLEQGIDQINRVPSTQANLDIAPGSEIGSSILNVVYGESDPVRLSFTLETDRKPDGYGQSASLGFEADNVVGVNDTFYLGLSGSETSNTLSASLSFPLGYWTFTGQATYSESESLLTATSRLFEPTTSASITADWLIHRDDRTKTRLTFALGRNDQERFVNGTALAPQRLSTIEFGWQREIFGQGLYFSPRMSLTFGRLMDDQSQVTPGSGPQIDYRLFKAGFTSRRSWENGASLFLSLSTQAADGPLFSAEKISIGGSGSLRGINGESVSGDRGFTARSELSLPVAAWAERNGSAALSAFAARGAFYTFLDLGAVRDLEGADWDYGAGLGIGLDYQVHETTSLRFYLGAPLTRSENLQTGGLEIGLSATVKVF